MAVVEQVAFAAASAAVALFAAVSAALVVETAAPGPQVGPDGRVPAWVEEERGSCCGGAPRASPSAGAG